MRCSLRFASAFLSTALALAACSDDSADSDGNGGEAEGGGTVDGGGTADGGGGGGEQAACASGSLVDTSGLVLNGDGEHVTMGVAPELGLATFTLEAWVRRDAAGTLAGTGVGGLQLVPIIAKGRGENDGSNVDCNYAFGFFGDVLGADFEDMESGLNHPVYGTTPVPWGSWHHVAVTYDGTTWSLFVDGVLDGVSEANATPRSDSIQHFAIGTAMNSTGTPSGSLAGGLDEVRVWDAARTEAEIAASMYTTVTSAPGLVGRWALDTEDAAAPDSAGSNPGTLVGGMFASPAAPTELGAPPVVAPEGPEDGAVVTGSEVQLELDIDEPEGSEVEVAFHVREVGADDDFTIVVLPDTQYYTVPNNGFQDYFYDQTKWVVANHEAYNIVGVIHNGDIVDAGAVIAQWTVADTAMSTLEEPLRGMPDGMPYGVCVGNHDQSPNGNAGNTENFNVYFGVDRFESRPYYGGHYSSDNDENWVTFSAGGLDFVVVNLQFDPDANPAVLAWARSIFESHPDAFGILNTHYLLGSGGNFGAQGQAIYNALRDVDNVQLMTSGHVSAEARRTDEFEGNTIHTMLADYQFRDDGGAGYMRIWEFSPQSGELTVRSYSPTLDTWETDENSEFTIPVELPGAGKAAFTELARIDSATTSATASFTGLEPGKIYEWYATVTDCAHVVTTPVRTFTTAP